ncbi:MAG: hypothetical protein FD157_3178 [Rhodocyclaceae bacterium]|nr:MAG: hypothetical protein FD157_3178 [Rhodocyclaceae bacterium]TND00423.1 MAG: hypothetical protein FD118_3124 [Rhodocyclaceae bacterium]
MIRVQGVQAGNATMDATERVPQMLVNETLEIS